MTEIDKIKSWCEDNDFAYTRTFDWRNEIIDFNDYPVRIIYDNVMETLRVVDTISFARYDQIHFKTATWALIQVERILAENGIEWGY